MSDKDELPIFPDGIPIYKGDKNLPTFPNIPPDKITIIAACHFEESNIQNDADIMRIIKFLYNYPEREFYLFLKKGKKSNRDLIYNLEKKGILANTTELHFYRHPNNVGRDYIRIYQNKIQFDWQRDVINKGPMYVRIKLDLSERKKRELEIQEKIEAEKNADTNPLELKPNFFGFGLDLQKIFKLLTKISLKKSTLLAIIGITYIFSLRTIGTVFPAIFKNPQIVKIAGILSLVAILTLIFFFISFYRDYVQPGQTKLQKASILAIIGAALGFLRVIKNLLPVFNVYIFRYQSWSSHIDTLAPWVNSVFILIFFVIFYGEVPHREQMKLKRATFFAIIGTSIMALLRTFLLFNHLYAERLTWLIDFSREMVFIFFPVFIFGFATVLYFLISFYRGQMNI